MEGPEGATHVSVAQARAKQHVMAATSASLRERLARVDGELQAALERAEMAEMAEADAREWREVAEEWHAEAEVLQAHVAAVVAEKRAERKKRQAAQRVTQSRAAT